jgi:hypothetical protein
MKTLRTLVEHNAEAVAFYRDRDKPRKNGIECATCESGHYVPIYVPILHFLSQYYPNQIFLALFIE